MVIFKALLGSVFVENKSLQSALLSMVLFGPHYTPWDGLGRDDLCISQMRKQAQRCLAVFWILLHKPLPCSTFLNIGLEGCQNFPLIATPVFNSSAVLRVGLQDLLRGCPRGNYFHNRPKTLFAFSTLILSYACSGDLSQQTKAEVDMKSQPSSIRPDIREIFKNVKPLFFYFGKCNYFS